MRRAILRRMGARTKNGLRAIVGQNVRALRLAGGKTQEEIADKAGITPVYLSRIESARANCTLDVLEATAAALGVRPADLLNRAD